jgi:hypothetical protein
MLRYTYQLTPLEPKAALVPLNLEWGMSALQCFAPSSFQGTINSRITLYNPTQTGAFENRNSFCNVEGSIK